jgi:hypothetical protein
MTPMIGRTHGVHAEPMTFGVKLALWYAELARGRARWAQPQSGPCRPPASRARRSYNFIIASDR